VGPTGEGGGGFPTAHVLGTAWGRGRAGTAGPRAGAHSGERRGGGWAALASWVAREERGWAGPKRGGRGREKRKGFSFFPKIYFLDECFHNFNQSKQMHGSAWCSKPK
jgi:hypothetical protein